MKTRLAIAALLLCNSWNSTAAITATRVVDDAMRCPAADALVVLDAGQVPELIDHRIDGIRLYRNNDGRLEPVTLQIDPRDDENRYLLEPQAEHARIDANDQLVFMRSAAGPRRWSGSTEPELIELELDATPSQPAGWLYVRTGVTERASAASPRIRYYPDLRSVRTDLYTIGFSERLPFLMDSLSWRLPLSDEWSPDVADTMKIRHTGKIFGAFEFRRTQEDYQSELVAVRSGPLRVILRTENRVRIWWKLKSPALYVDFVMMPDGFVMDTIVDIPFNIGLFMSGVETLTTVDWNQDPELPPLFIRSPLADGPLRVDGSMSPAKQRFNDIRSRHFTVSSAWGVAATRLDFGEEVPIDVMLYLRDDLSRPDPPEERVGQFGNVGFLTTGWEKINTEVHHLEFSVCLSPPRHETPVGAVP